MLLLLILWSLSCLMQPSLFFNRPPSHWACYFSRTISYQPQWVASSPCSLHVLSNYYITQTHQIQHAKPNLNPLHKHKDLNLNSLEYNCINYLFLSKFENLFVREINKFEQMQIYKIRPKTRLTPKFP